ncbi:hypothetical protein ACDF64_16095 [Agromyces sp. MMS24-JH15]|uniref:hypothetical protein n=1 Tax=Agromyces sp. MMS24-JH15 TaxID=3243765 RepID=UPI003747C19D
MVIRRGFLRWLFPAAVVLPIWLVVGWAVYGSGGWTTLGLLITIPSNFLALLVIALMVQARPSVRAERAVSWLDVGVIGLWHLLIVAAGFYGSSAVLFGVLALVAAVAAFWTSLWQLVTDGAKRMQATMAEYERLAGQGPADAPGKPPSDDGDGDVFIIHESRD